MTNNPLPDVSDLAVESTGAGPLVVLVHGTAPSTWGSLPAMLAADHRVITYARRSFPPSRAPSPGSLRAHTDDLAALIETDGAPAVIVGWSMGGVIAIDLAVCHPRLVSGLVLLEPPLRLKRRPTLRMLRAVVGAQIAGRRDPGRGASRFLQWALTRSDGTTDLGRLDPVRLEAAANAIVAELRAGTGEREIKYRQLSTITCPAHWLIGADGIAEFATAARRAKQCWPSLQLQRVPGAGHAIQLDRPDIVAAALRDLETATVACGTHRESGDSVEQRSGSGVEDSQDLRGEVGG